MATISIAEILELATKAKTKKEKVEILQKHESQVLKEILAVTYDKKRFEMLLPESVPPYTPSDFPDSHGLLYRESRKFMYFIKGFKGDNLPNYKREAMFIQMLESVHKDDAVVLEHFIQRKPFKGLTAATINTAFPALIRSAVKD